MTFEELMDYAVETDCSDVHITVGTNIAIRRNGIFEILDLCPTTEEAEDMIFTILSDDEIRRVKAGEDVDIGIMIDSGIRIRANIFHQRNNIAATIRLLMDTIPPFEQLGLPTVIRSLAELTRGIILVTGPTGSGKSTTLAAIVDYINRTYAKHVITIEDPIEYVYPHDKSMIHQREVGRDVDRFDSALRSSLREDPDIILVGEMRDFETISAALTAAETGHLVLSTLHTTSAAQTVERIIDASPVECQEQIRTQFANCLRGVIAQQLLPTVDKKSRVVATEVMIGTPAIQNLIREDKTIQIPAALMAGKRDGMHTLNEDLLRLLQEGTIARKSALIASNDRVEFEQLLTGSGYDPNNTPSRF